MDDGCDIGRPGQTLCTAVSVAKQRFPLPPASLDHAGFLPGENGRYGWFHQKEKGTGPKSSHDSVPVPTHLKRMEMGL